MDKNNIRITFGIVLFSLLFAMLIGAGLISLLTALFPDLAPTNISIFSMLISTLLIGLPVILYLRSKGLSLHKRLRLNSISRNTFISVLIISVGFIVIVDELDRIVYTIFGSPEFLKELVDQLKITSLYNAIFIIMTTVIVAPLIEELLFRGFLQQVLEDSWADITRAILTTSLFFALVHLNIYWIVQIYLLGFVLGYLAWRTNSIFPSIILHGLNNGFAVVLNNVGDVFSQYYNWRGHVNPIWIFIAIVLIILGFKMLNKDLENQL